MAFSTWVMAGQAGAQGVGLGVDSEGWTVLTPSVDSRIVYVSSAMGDDANSGLSPEAPKRTIAAAYQLMRTGYPDWMLLKCGNAWNESFSNWEKSGRSTAEPMVIRSYGQGNRPQVNSGISNGFNSSATNIALTDIKFVAHTYNGSNGEPLAISMIGRPTNFLIENCMIEGYLTGMVIQSLNGQRPSGIALRRNIVVDSYRVGFDLQSAGCYLDGIDGLLMEENLFDHNGWREDIPNALPNIFRRNIYIQGNCTGVVTRRNIIARSASEGMQQRAGGVCEDNLFLRNCTGLIIASGGVVRNNVVLDSRDLDANNPRGGGIEVDGAQGVLIESNIITQRTTPASYNLGGISIVHGAANVVVRSNIIYDWWFSGAPEAVCIGMESGVSNVLVENNDFQMPHGEYIVRMSGWATFRGNRYLSPNSTPFWTVNGPRTFSQWLNEMPDDGSVFQAVPYPDPGRNAGRYVASIGLPGTLDMFLFLARQQSRQAWSPVLTAAAVNQYVREGFGAEPSAPCVADFNNDHRLDVNDIVQFMTCFSACDPRADLAQDGYFNVLDFMAYQAAYASGCE